MFVWGWVVEPDPDYQLSTFTCANRSYKDGGDVFAGLSDSFYCNKDYDALYEKQASQIDPAQRAETVKQMQQMLYDDAPYVAHLVLRRPQAYSDKWTGFVAAARAAAALLFQYGTYSYRNIERKKATAAAAGAAAGLHGVRTAGSAPARSSASAPSWSCCSAVPARCVARRRGAAADRE